MKGFYYTSLFILSFVFANAQTNTAFDFTTANSNDSQSKVIPEYVTKVSSDWSSGGLFEGLKPEDELIEERTQISKKIRNGTDKIEVFIGGPFHYKDENGTWRDISLSLEPIYNIPFSFQNITNTFKSRFGTSHETGIELEYKEQILQYGLNTVIYSGAWQTSNTGTTLAPVIDQADILYKSVYDGIDLSYEVAKQGIQHQLVFQNSNIFDSLPSASDNVYVKEQLKIPSGSLLKDDTGYITDSRAITGNLYIEYDSNVLYTILHSRVWDNSFTGNPLEPASDLSNFIFSEMEVIIENNEIFLISSIPVSWLKDSNRTYPVVLDPNVYIDGVSSPVVGYRYPFNTCRRQRISQILFQRGDIGISGTITDIAFYRGNNNGYTASNVTIKMQDVSWNPPAMTTCIHTSSGFTTVASSASLNTSSGWKNISVSNFNHNNTKDLLLETSFSNSSSSVTTSCDCNSTSSGGSFGYVSAAYDGHRWAYSNTSTPPPTTNCPGSPNDCPSPIEDNPGYGSNIPATRITIGTTQSCTNWAVTPSSQNIPATVNGNTYSTTVTSNPGGCTYSYTINDSWINFVSTSSGGVFNFTAQNNTGSSRTGTIDFHNLTDNIYNVTTLTITQAGSSTPSCISPTATVNNVSGTGSATLSCNTSGGSGGSIRYKWYSGTSCVGSVLGTSSTLTVSSSGNYACKAYIDGYEFTCFACDYGNATITNPQSDISITSSIIPPWQRENDSYQGSVSVSTSNPTNAAWHLQVKVYNTSTGSLINTINYPSITSSTQSFSSSDSQLSSISIEGRQLKFYAVLDVNSSTRLAGTTDIIEKKWDNKNYVLYNISGESFRVPIKYIPDATKVTVGFCRNNSYSSLSYDNIKKIGLGECSPLISPPCINTNCNLSFSPQFCQFINEDGYFNLSIGGVDNNLSTVPAGVFEYAIGYFDSQNNQISCEQGTFDMTKMGNINNSNSSNDVVVLIGGSANIELAIENLPSTNTNESTIPWSIANEFSEEGYNVWYIALGNMNPLQKNAYNIGIALEDILEKCPSGSELTIFTHSKSGLETRLMLDGKGIPNSASDQFNSNPTNTFNNINLNGQLANVVFYAVPHEGVKVWKYSSTTIAPFNYVNQYLRYNSPAVNYLRSGSATMPNSISLCNIAAFRNCDDHDGGVDLESSEALSTSYPNFKRYYYIKDPGVPIDPDGNPLCSAILPGFEVASKLVWQIAPLYELLEILCPILDVTLILGSTHEWGGGFHHGFSTSSYILNHIQVSCPVDGDGISTFERINNFIRGTNISSNCTSPLSVQCQTWWQQLLGSEVTNADVFVQNSSGVYKLGDISDEKGILRLGFHDDFLPGDTVRIIASGMRDIQLPLEQIDVQGNKLNIIMFREGGTTQKLINPRVIKLTQSLIDTSGSLSFLIEAENALSFEFLSISDTNFVPITLNNGIFTTQLENGLNELFFKINGAIDTVMLLKRVFYIPADSLTYYSYPITLLSGNSVIGTKLYIDDQFIAEMDESDLVLDLFYGKSNLTFKRFGYRDTTISLDSITSIDIDNHLIPYSYSFPNDSVVFDFSVFGSSRTWRSTGLVDTSGAASVKLKQYDHGFSNMGLIAKSRKFELTALTQPNGNIQFAAGLDQIEYLSEDSIYLMRIYDDNLYTKIEFDTTATIAGYDSLVQKVSYNSVNFNSGTAIKEALVIMKKQAPLFNNQGTLNVNENDILFLPVSSLVIDPDSIENDLTYQIENVSAGLSVQINNDSLIIIPDACWYGDANFTIKAKHDGLWRSFTQEVEVISSPLPEVATDGPTNFCEGNSITLTAESGSNFLWSNGATGNSIVVNSTGVYTVSVTDSFNCVRSSVPLEVMVNPLPIPTITANGSTEFCEGESVILTSSSLTGNLWSNNEQGSTIEVDIAGDYTVMVTDSNGCSGISPTISINLYNLPNVVAEASSANLCTGEELTLSGSGAQDYVWSNGVQNAVPFTPDVTLTYSVTGTDLNGCEDSDQITVTVTNVQSPQVSVLGPTEFCPGDATSLVFTNQGYDSFIWSNGQNDQILTVSESGEYYATAYIANCSAISDTIAIEVHSPVSPSITVLGDTHLCDETGTTLVCSPSNSYLWSTQETTTDISVNQAGAYYVSVIDVNGCQATSDTIIIEVFTSIPPIITVEEGTLLCNETGTFLICSPSASYQWSNQETSDTIWVDQAGEYYVSVIDSNGCTATSDTVSITTGMTPIAGFNYQQGTPDVTFIDQTLNSPSEWLWDFGDGNTSSDQNPIYEYSSSGIYTVTLIVSNDCGADTFTTDINLIATGVSTNVIDNELSIYPNPTSGNLFIRSNVSGLEAITIEIYTSMGKLIYSDQDNFSSSKNTISLNIYQYTSGTYFVRITGNGQVYTKSIIYEKN